ncbi:MAG: hypothetical protein QNK05_20915 [Myxococcota bacterium]|nr:hypothetical protein [Myxococcota bacterium]
MRSRPERTRRGAFCSGLALLCLALGAGGLGCGPRYARTTIVEGPVITVKLRAEKVSGGLRDRGYSHPASISGIRLAHIFSRVDVRPSGKDGQRRGAIPTALLYDVGEAVSAALAKADSSQEVSVQAVRKARNLGLFTNVYYTSFLVWVKGDELFLHFSRSDDLLSKDEEDELREARRDQEVQGFKMIAAESIRPLAAQTVSVAWRHPRFREASHLRIDERGQVRRRQVLMEGDGESDAEEPAGLPPLPPPPGPLPSDPEILRALADLEDERRAGRLTEVEYRSRRERLLGASGP